MSQNEFLDLNTLKADIESYLGWGKINQWTNYDFERLSDQIEEKTSVRLSVSTLKRIFGKVQYQGDPSQNTLNTLCKFIGHQDWRSYQSHCILADEPSKKIEKAETTQTPLNESDKNQQEKSIKLNYGFNQARVYIYAGFFLALAILMIAAVKLNPKRSPSDIVPELFSFKADKMFTKGLPNSVVFTYDASNSRSDSIYITQTWDITRKVLVDKTNHQHSAIYYYPGYFRSKLIIDSIIVKEHDVQIATDGWLGLVEKPFGQVPLYFTKDEIIQHDSCISVSEKLLNKYKLSLLPETPKIRFFNQGDLGELKNDNFSFETNLKTEFSSGDGACQYVQVLIQCVDDIIIIPLAARSCIGNLHLVACGAYAESKTADLSGFGADLHQWAKLEVISENGNILFWVNGNKAYELKMKHETKRIVGVQYRFNGLGAVKGARFKNEKGEVIKL